MYTLTETYYCDGTIGFFIREARADDELGKKWRDPAKSYIRKIYVKHFRLEDEIWDYILELPTKNKSREPNISQSHTLTATYYSDGRLSLLIKKSSEKDKNTSVIYPSGSMISERKTIVFENCKKLWDYLMQQNIKPTLSV